MASKLGNKSGGKSGGKSGKRKAGGKYPTATGLHVTDGLLLPVTVAPNRNKGGRPSTFTPELAERVLEQVAEGRFLVDLEGEDMPAYRTIWGWANVRPEFAKALARSHEDGAHALLVKAETLLDEATRDDIQVVRERVAHIRWRVSRLNPAAYGDRSELRVSGTITHEHKLSDDAPAWIKERLEAPQPTTSSLIDVTPDPKPH